jgi:hypothetical protein
MCLVLLIGSGFRDFVSEGAVSMLSTEYLCHLPRVSKRQIGGITAASELLQ